MVVTIVPEVSHAAVGGKGTSVVNLCSQAMPSDLRYLCVHCGFFYCGCGKQPCSNSVSIGFQPFDAVIRNHIDIDHKFVISGLWQTIRFLTLVCSGEAQPSRADCCWESLGGFNTQVRMALHNV